MKTTNITEENEKQLKTMRENFKALRENKGWGFKELSKISKISVNTLADIEQGEDFDVIYLIRLCRIYNIEPHKIFSPVVL